MTEALDISITKAQRSKLQDINLENIPFGKYFTDHMLEVDFEDGEDQDTGEESPDEDHV